MKKFQVGAVLSLFLLLTSCSFHRGTVVESSSSPAVVSYNYWYYPDCQVYYDYQRHYYYYPENNLWRQSAVPPSRYNLSTTHVVVEVKSEKPYVDYDKHRIKYPAPKPVMDKKEVNSKENRDHKMDLDRKDPKDSRKDDTKAKGNKGRDDKMEKAAQTSMDRVNPKDKRTKAKKTEINSKTNKGKKGKTEKETMKEEKNNKDGDREDNMDSKMDRGQRDKGDGGDRKRD